VKALAAFVLVALLALSFIRYAPSFNALDSGISRDHAHLMA
jgi:hypothetical protein